jgi:chorismate synthase
MAKLYGSGFSTRTRTNTTYIHPFTPALSHTHHECRYQVKYGIRASSGGGRSSARETIGRVAAGAVAEKFLRESYKTEVVAFVCSIGDIQLPNEAWRHSTGRPWTRKEVDEEGQLQVRTTLA